VHLIRRFFSFVTAEPLTPHEQQQVRDVLDPGLARIFFDQRFEDQRHALTVQHRVGRSGSLAQAALLHDVGKTESDLGAVSRSIATLWNGVGLPTTGAWRSYLDHATIGADILHDLEANHLVVAFTRFHPGPPPNGIDPSDWHALEEADNA
jgi:hypothetical protein